MTAYPTAPPGLDPHTLAGDARSVLACPAAAWLVVDGSGTAVALGDSWGTPTVEAPPGSPVAAAAAARRPASLRVASGLAPRHGVPELLALGGRLAAHGDDTAVLVVSAVVLHRAGRSHPVSVAQFHAPEHRLNRGFLQRAADHATRCHQDELRRAVSASTGRPMGDLLAAGLSALTPSGVDVTWVDLDGAHRTRLVFSRTARSTSELGEVLRRELHAGL